MGSRCYKIFISQSKLVDNEPNRAEQHRIRLVTGKITFLSCMHDCQLYANVLKVAYQSFEFNYCFIFRSAVTAVAWHPLGKYLVSVDRAKTVILWGNS